jgi:hypothetical protein
MLHRGARYALPARKGLLGPFFDCSISLQGLIVTRWLCTLFFVHLPHEMGILSETARPGLSSKPVYHATYDMRFVKRLM